MSLSIKTFSITTLSIMTMSMTFKKAIISINMSVMLSVLYVKCVFALLNYAIAEHSYAKFHLC